MQTQHFKDKNLYLEHFSIVEDYQFWLNIHIRKVNVKQD